MLNFKSLVKFSLATALSTALMASAAAAEKREVPDRAEGDGQYKRLILRGGYVIDGTGAPPFGPVDIVVEKDRIAEIRNVGTPGVAIDPKNRPQPGDREIDVQGKYIMPGFIDLHSHIHSLDSEQGVSPEYIFKLQLGHGITTIRSLGSGGDKRVVGFKRRSAMNEITAPRIVAFPMFYGVTSPEAARKRVQEIKKNGADGIKFFGAPEEILWAALDEAKKQGLMTTMHHAQLDVTHANVLTTSAHGLGSMEHWYGLPEALFEDKVIQNYPTDYIYNNEQDRFSQAGRLWKQAAKPGSKKWNEVMDTLLARDFALDPTFTIYLASRDLMRMSRAVWHDEYTMPNLWEFYRPNRESHGAFWFYWTTQDEIEWKNNYKLWMQFINEYKNRGGKVGLGSDTGYIYSLYGFGYIQEMELMQEAGFHPLEVIRAATQIGAQIIKKDDEIGTLQVGKKADIVIVDENPVHNLKVLYGTGAIKLNDSTGKVERIGGVRWTIKDGIVYDAYALREDVKKMVRDAKNKAGISLDKPLSVAN
ncbi:amidohydrolase family protein [Paremcibacter congregatus]|uniref:amidohydrolase family protein n=1 Tax=Paremcibacter congregatus TaxID=2043170 RepID=UPI0030EE3309|tara:strand:- start:19194 stop:20789 length:1596 start_codon:yes stop_codon:yes gene_type:complete